MIKFENAEDVWFYFMECQKLKDSGGKPISSGQEKICSPLDVAIIFTHLKNWGFLKRHHINTIINFGRNGYRPDYSVYDGHKDERQAAKWWDEAMEILSKELIKKGVIRE